MEKNTVIQNNILYNLSEQNVHYNNDFEYRKWLRRLFCMKMPDLDENEVDENLDQDDIISRDEADFDEKSATNALDFVFNNTKDNIYFQELYSLAASKMLSLDQNIGLSVLYSYDYMALFHYCVCCYIENNDEFNDTNVWFVRLRKKLT